MSEVKFYAVHLRNAQQRPGVLVMALLGALAAVCSRVHSPSRQHHLMYHFPRFTSMPALRELWVEDFRHCVTQLSDVIGGGRDVSSGSTKDLPQLVARYIYHWAICFMTYLKETLRCWQDF